MENLIIWLRLKEDARIVFRSSPASFSRHPEKPKRWHPYRGPGPRNVLRPLPQPEGHQALAAHLNSPGHPGVTSGGDIIPAVRFLARTKMHKDCLGPGCLARAAKGEHLSSL